MKTVKLDDGEYEVMRELPFHAEDYVVLRKLPDNPMPHVTRGVWYKADNEVREWNYSHSDFYYMDEDLITEIRKPDGTVWRKDINQTERMR